MGKLKLLVPMDGTEFSRRIEPQVRKLFPADHWELRLLHVARVPVDPATVAYEPAAVGPDYRLYMYGYELPGADLHPMYSEDRLEDFRQALERDLQYEVKLFQEEGYEVSAAVNFGEPAEAIVAYAEEAGVDVVAMATHNRKGFERLIHGSVARRALNRLSVPTLLLRVEEDDSDQEAPRRGRAPEERTTGEEARAQAGDGRARRGERGEPHPGARMPAAAGDGDAVRKDDQEVSPAETEPATLAGLHGRGVLTITWADSGHAVATKGSWFPDDPDDDLAPLEQAERYDRSVIYEGRAVDAETAGHDDDAGERVRRPVRITSVRKYQDYGGHTRTLVSFELIGEPDRTDVPDQYSKSEFDRLGLEEIASITGIEPPAAMGRAEEAEYREKAWKSYKLDIEHRDEWGTARQNTALPHGE
jgi:nucleotide-binding universal stress UspA family protein